MGVYIKGMEMPKNCGECELCACYVFEDGTEENYRCPMTMYPIHDFDERHYLCPLVPVPAHGRLIDADALMGVIRAHDYPLKAHFNSTDNGMFTIGIQQAVDEAPTIIPAEEGE